MLRKYRTHSWPCRAVLLDILTLSQRLRCFLDVLWVPSRDNPADAPSRIRVHNLLAVPPWFAGVIRTRFRPQC